VKRFCWFISILFQFYFNNVWAPLGGFDASVVRVGSRGWHTSPVASRQRLV